MCFWVQTSYKTILKLYAADNQGIIKTGKRNFAPELPLSEIQLPIAKNVEAVDYAVKKAGMQKK